MLWPFNVQTWNKVWEIVKACAEDNSGNYEYWLWASYECLWDGVSLVKCWMLLLLFVSKCFQTSAVKPFASFVWWLEQPISNPHEDDLFTCIRTYAWYRSCIRFGMSSIWWHWYKGANNTRIFWENVCWCRQICGVRGPPLFQDSLWNVYDHVMPDLPVQQMELKDGMVGSTEG